MPDVQRDQDREKDKGAGAVPWMRAAKSPLTQGWGGAAVRGGGSGLAGLGGEGAAILKAGLAPALKVLLNSHLALSIALTAGITLSGYGLYDMMRRGGFGARPAPSASSLFASRESAGEETRTALDAAKPDSSLDLASKANQGAFDPAAADAAAGVPVEPVDADGPAAAVAGAAPADTAALPQSAADAAEANAAPGDKGALAARFGKLSSTLGGGNSLSGGAGLAGGIGQQFSSGPKPPAGAKTDKLSGLSSGRKAQVTRGKRTADSMGRSAMKSATAQKLSKMQGAMASASGVNPETSAAVHNREWESSGAIGSGITGAGAGGIDAGDGTGSDAAGMQNGSPTESAASANPATDDAPAVTDTENQTPYQALIDIATLLLAVATVIALIIAILAKTGIGTAIAVALCKVNVALGAIVALMGLGIMMQGQMLQGGLFTAVGSIIAVCSYAALGGSGQEVTLSSNAAALSVAATVAGLLGTSLGLMGGKSGDS